MTTYDNVLIMLTRMSLARGDYAGLMKHMLTKQRFQEMIDILTAGADARWWTSTRLLLGLSHDEAVRMGNDLREFFAQANSTTLRLDSLGVTCQE